MATEAQFDEAVEECRKVFVAKYDEYGPSWRFFRVSSLCDRIFTKSARIRRLELLGGSGKVEDSIEYEFMGIANYAIMLLDRLANEGLMWPLLNDPVPVRWSDKVHAVASYDRVVTQAKGLLLKKNHDYDEAWRHILLTTFTDEVISRTLRVQQLILSGCEDVGIIEAQLIDALNYSMLALIRLRAEIS